MAAGNPAILFVLTATGVGGGEKQAVDLALALKRRGWRVSIVSMIAIGVLGRYAVSRGMDLISLELRRGVPDPRGVIRLARIVRQFKPDVVHAHMFHANLLARLVRLLVPVPLLICTAHSVNEGGPFRMLLYRLTDGLCDVTTQVSEAGRARYLRIGAARRAALSVVPNGIDVTAYRADAETRQEVRQREELDKLFVWIAVGRLEPAKDYPNLLTAFRRVVDASIADVALLVAGDGPLRDFLHEYAERLQLSSKVRFLGERLDIPDLLCAADALVLSSAWEGFGLAVGEAQLAGLPVVATDCGGPREVLAPRAGLLVPPGNAQALAQAMIGIMQLSEPCRREMGARGRRHVASHFSLDRIVDKWATLYKKETTA
jgi:glycosyltransferase involved in cell wall biosynthesis